MGLNGIVRDGRRYDGRDIIECRGEIIRDREDARPVFPGLAVKLSHIRDRTFYHRPARQN